MANQMQRKKIVWPPGLLQREKNNKFVSFATVFLNLHSQLGKRISLEEKHENFIAVMRKWEMLAPGENER